MLASLSYSHHIIALSMKIHCVDVIFNTDMLASRLAHEQKRNRQLMRVSPPVTERSPPNWMVPRASERDEHSLPRSISPPASEFGCE